MFVFEMEDKETRDGMGTDAGWCERADVSRVGGRV